MKNSSFISTVLGILLLSGILFQLSDDVLFELEEDTIELSENTDELEDEDEFLQFSLKSDASEEFISQPSKMHENCKKTEDKYPIVYIKIPSPPPDFCS